MFSTPKKVFLTTKKGLSAQPVFMFDETLIVLNNIGKLDAWNKGVKQLRINTLNGPAAINPAFRSGNFTTMINQDQNYLYAGKTLYKIYLKQDRLESEIAIEDIDLPVISAIYFNKEQNKYYIGSLVSGLFVVTPNEFHAPKIPPGALDMGFYNQCVTEEGILSQRFLFRKDGASKEYPLTKYLTSALYKDNRSFYYAPSYDLDKMQFKNRTKEAGTTFGYSSILNFHR